ncbi:MAG: mannose-1-phosphate guanylyltransferase [Polyangiaceae bacterium]
MAGVYAVVMAGGSGTRFWPASRQRLPKQLLPLADDPDEALLAATLRRIAPLVPAENVYIATSERLRDETLRVVPKVPTSQVMAEPAARNTAPCIAWATSAILRRDPEALVVVLPSDHYVTDEDEFRNVVARALASAKSGTVTTIGILPTRPETGYGYIELGDDRGQGVRAVKRFVEKPSQPVAEEYVAGKKHLWNAGMFFFPARVMQDAIARHLPELHAGIARIDAAARRGDEAREVAATFPTLPAISIDHGVMEKLDGLAVVPGDFGWSDVGSWQTAWELGEKDANGNVLSEIAIAIDAKRNLVRDLRDRSAKRVIALVGVDDLVVVETEDALLVIPRRRAQDVRLVVEALKAGGKAEHL